MLRLKGETVHKCVICGTKTTDGRKVDKVGFVCNNCARLKSYYYDVLEERGKVGKKHSFGFEVELADRRDYALRLLKYGFVATEDSSVAAEYKSPVFYDKRGLKWVYDVLDESVNWDEMVSTHLHIGIDHQSKRELNYYWDFVWEPIVDFLYNNKIETRRIFGRFFNEFAIASANSDERYSAFNILTDYDTFEIRLAKYTTRTQYDKLIDWGRQVGHIFDSMSLQDSKIYLVRKAIVRTFGQYFNLRVIY
jgi:hypothetical protein